MERAPRFAAPVGCSSRMRPTNRSSSLCDGRMIWRGPAGASSSRPRPCCRRGFRGSSSKTRKPCAYSKALKPAEKRLVVELGETAQILARRYPHEAETMVRRLGPEGLTAVRVFGDDVAEVLVKEGPESLGVLRKTGRGGWSFFTHQVLPHKKKLAAAGVLTAFMVDPEKFVDFAGKATEYAVSEFGRAGIQLASAVGGGAARGLETSIGQTLAAYGLNFPAFRYLGMGLAGLAVLLSFMVVIGMPIRWMFRPFGWVLRRDASAPTNGTIIKVITARGT